MKLKLKNSMIMKKTYIAPYVETETIEYEGYLLDTSIVGISGDADIERGDDDDVPETADTRLFEFLNF
jgi:hypothetical protein